MTTRTAEFLGTAPVALAVIATMAVASGVGLGIGLAGWPVAAGLLAAGAGIICLRRPFLGLLVLVAIIPVENLVATQGLSSPVKLVGAAVFGAWFLRKIALRESWRPVITGGLFVATLLFLADVLGSVAWARYPSVARSGFLSLALLAALAFLIIDLANSRQRIDIVIKLLILSATVSVGLTVYQFQFLGLRRAGEDIAGGVNGTAMLLLTALPFGFYLVRSGRRAGWRLLGLAFVPLASLGIALTFSRFNLLLILPILALMFTLTLRERSNRPWLMTLVVGASVMATLWVPWDQVQRRVETIRPYLLETIQFGEEQATTSPRGYHLRVGLAIARDHPLRGVGYGNYGYYFLEEYQFQVSGAETLYRSPRSPHSSYIGIAADLGLVGLALWLGVLLTGVYHVWRAWRQSLRSGNRLDVAFAESLAVALGISVVAYAWYAPIQHSKLLWLALGLCVAASRITAVPAVSERVLKS